MREQQLNIEHDINNSCFVCGKKREDIERIEHRKDGYDYHKIVRFENLTPLDKT